MRLPDTNKLRHYLILLLGLIVLVIAWWYFKPSPVPIGEWTKPKQAEQVKAIQQTIIQPAKVVVFKPVAKEALKLPPEIQQDQAKHVVAAVRIEPDLHPQTVTAIFDDQTGEVQTYTRIEPYPWLAAEHHGEIRIDVGVKNGLAKVGRLTLREDLLQLKAIHAGVHLTIDTDGSWFVGGGAGYRW